MDLPALIKPGLIDAALRDAIDDGHGNWLVPAYDVPDHFTVARKIGFWDGLAVLNRVGLAWRSELLRRTERAGR